MGSSPLGVVLMVDGDGLIWLWVFLLIRDQVPQDEKDYRFSHDQRGGGGQPWPLRAGLHGSALRRRLGGRGLAWWS